MKSGLTRKEEKGKRERKRKRSLERMVRYLSIYTVFLKKKSKKHRVDHQGWLIVANDNGSVLLFKKLNSRSLVFFTSSKRAVKIRFHSMIVESGLTKEEE